MSSLSFDAIAHIYDMTRGLPEAVTLQAMKTIDGAASATSQTSFLDVGIGTGRLAFPLASLGRTYTGVDSSAKMLEQLERKLTIAGWEQKDQPWGSLPDEDPETISQVLRYTQTEPPASIHAACALRCRPFTIPRCLF